jgi:acetyl esterase
MTQGPRRAGAFSALASLLVAGLTLGPIAPANPKTPITVENDVVYSFAAGQPLTLDVYRPEEGWGHPSLLLIHGGSWKRGDKSDLEWVARDLARGGFVAFVPNYRLAPPNGLATYPMPVDDLRVAWDWVEDKAVRYHGSTQNMAVVGSSAGGHLGLMLTAELLEDPNSPAPPDAVVGFSPPADLAMMASEGVLRWAVRDHIGCKLRDCPDSYANASPVNRVAPQFPPTFLSYGTEELIPLAHGQVLQSKLTEARVVNRFVTVEGSAHALRRSGVLIPKAMRFLRHNM